jgi:hypothetical protein
MIEEEDYEESLRNYLVLLLLTFKWHSTQLLSDETLDEFYCLYLIWRVDPTDIAKSSRCVHCY